MLKKVSILFSSLVLCIMLSCSSVFALDFDKLPGGIDVSIIPDTYDVIQTGQTDSGIIYVISAKLKANGDGANLSPYIDSSTSNNINIIGFDRAKGTFAYNIYYTQAGSYPKISTNSKNYFYYVNSTNIVKIDLGTGLPATSPASGILNGSIPTSGTFTTADAQTITAKFIAVNENDELYILGKRSDTVMRINYYNGSAWTDFITGPFPAPNSSGTPNAFCATKDSSGNKICYSAFGSTLYKSNNSTHTACTGTPSGTYYGVSVIAGINAGDAIFAFYSASNGYVYYCNGTTGACTQSLAAGGSYFSNKYYNLVYISGSPNASFSYWNGTYATYSIGSNGSAVPVQLPSNATQQSQPSVDSNGTNGDILPGSYQHASPTFVPSDGAIVSYNNLRTVGHITYEPNYSNTVPHTFPNGGSYAYDRYYHEGTYFYYDTNGYLSTWDASWNRMGSGTPDKYYGNASIVPYHYIKETIKYNFSGTYTSNNVLGAFGNTTMDTWIITKTTSNYSYYKSFKTLSNVVPVYGDTTYTSTTTSGPSGSSSTSSYVLTVVKGQKFYEAISDDLLGTTTAPDLGANLSVSRIKIGTTSNYYTLLSGTLSDSDITATNPTKGVVVNGKVVVFKVVAPPTNATAATLQFN